MRYKYEYSEKILWQLGKSEVRKDKTGLWRPPVEGRGGGD
jgi:hypothetical protein